MGNGFNEHCQRQGGMTDQNSVIPILSLSHYLMYSTRKSTPFTEPDLARAILMTTGLRASAVLRIKHCDILDEEHVYIRPIKRGKAKTIVIPCFIVLQMREVNPSRQYIFTITYKQLYDHCKRSIVESPLTKVNKNYSVTHSFRKKKVRDFLIEFKNPIVSIINHFGWKRKESIAYYL